MLTWHTDYLENKYAALHFKKVADLWPTQYTQSSEIYLVDSIYSTISSPASIGHWRAKVSPL